MYTTPALAAQIYDAHKSFLPQASHIVKLIWDKHWHLGNQAKAAYTAADYNELSTCPLCKEKDSQQHWIRECQESTLPPSLPPSFKKTLQKVRSQYIALVEGDMRKERRDKHENGWK